jgi:hypothetical protein
MAATARLCLLSKLIANFLGENIQFSDVQYFEL